MGPLERLAHLVNGPTPLTTYTPPRVRALTAAGARVNLATPGLVHTVHRAWQEDAWNYRDQVDELRFASEFVENCIGQLRIYAAARPTDDSDDPLPLDQVDDAGITQHTRDCAAALVDRLQFNQEGSGQLARMAVNFDIAGECYLLGEAGEEGEQWSIKSVSELQVTAGGARLVDLDSGGTSRELRADECDVLRLWNPHARWYERPDSPVAAMLGTLEGMVLVARRGRAHDRSRMSSGKGLYVPDELSLHTPGNAPVTPDTLGVIDDDTDVDSDPFMADIEFAMTEPIGNEESPAAVVPIIFRGPSVVPGTDRPMIDVLKTFDLHGEEPQKLDERYESLVRRFTRGINLARERVDGLGSTNHWNGALISADEFKMHVRPRAIRLVDSLTAAYFRAGLKAMGVPLEQRARVCIWFDASALVENPNREDAAQAAHASGVISDEALRKARGFTEDDAPDQRERLIRTLSDGRAYEASIPFIIAMSGLDWNDPQMAQAIRLVKQLDAAQGGGATAGPVVPGQVTTPAGRSLTPSAPASPTPPAPAGVAASGKRRGPKDDPTGPTVAGLALMAADTGRVLMLQRGLDDPDDPAAGTWEFPGGHIEDGDETSLHGAMREWAEEVGQPVPEGGAVVFGWTSADGVYQGHVVVIPEESALDLGAERTVRNADDDYSEQAAWWAPDDARRNPALRRECRRTPWSVLKKVASTVRSPVTAAAAREPARWRVDRRAGRRLVAIDRDLVTTVHAHAEAAVGRAVEKAANRIRGHHARKTSALAASFPKGADPRAVVASAGQTIAAGLDEAALLDGAFDDLEAVWFRELERAASAVEVVLDGMLERPVTAAGRSKGVAAAIVGRGRAAWEWLRPRLEARALDVLFGRSEGDPVPVSLVNGATTQAGGLPEQSSGVRDDGTLVDGGTAGGPGTGESVLSQLRVAGAVIAGLEFDYHPGIARETFPAHAKLHEQVVTGPTDPALAVATGDEWIPGGFYHPQDHGGCRCGWAPIAIVPMTDSPDPNDPQLAELRAQHIGGTS